MNSKNKKSRKSKRYIQWFGVVVIVLALVRCVSEIGGQDEQIAQDVTDSTCTQVVPESQDTLNIQSTQSIQSIQSIQSTPNTPRTQNVSVDWSKPHRIKGVSNFDKAFPDSNHVQLIAARRWGVSPVKDREDAENRKAELVYVGSSPYYIIKPLSSSIPYLVPHAALLLEDIGRNFMDSLQAKGLPLHYAVVTSVLRSEYDVKRLRRHNHNATEQSCHLYGTTFDINYNLYASAMHPEAYPVADYGEARYKQVLSEVLDDLRRQGRCYIKYERKQPCFHITVR